MGGSGNGYVELQVTTDFSFLRGASHAEELFATAKLMGYDALGVADRNTLAGVVRGHSAARQITEQSDEPIRVVIGSRLDLTCGSSLLVYPEDLPAYSRLCRLLTLGKGRAGKGQCHLGWDDLEGLEGLVAILVPDEPDDGLAGQLTRLKRLFGRNAYLALTRRFRPNDHQRLADLADMGWRARVPTVATNDVLYHAPTRRTLQDVMTCIREGCTVDALGFRRERFADRHLKPPEEMARLFQRYPEAVARTREIAERCRFAMPEIKYPYPKEVVLPGMSPQQALVHLTWKGAWNRYPTGIPEKVERQLEYELNLIGELDYAPYFLTVNSIVTFAKKEGILAQGRGSAANSAVCYVLGITSINPTESNLLFERFVSADRREPPDIDVDFEHERRELVIQWIYETYGRDRAALAATVIRYRPRGAIRDVGKAMGLSEDVIAALSSSVSGWSTDGITEAHAREIGLNLSDTRLRLALALARELIGFPRHLSQHPGGFVLSRGRLDDLVPIEPARMKDRAVVEWDKDDLDELKFMKVDVLGLGMLGVLRRSFDLLKQHKKIEHDLSSIEQDDTPTYDMICDADTMGVFQIESRAQMSMLPRLKPRKFYDLVIEIAIVRPGPIQGDMVHPYLRRRDGLEEVEYPKPEFRAVLGDTLGVPLFQEQAMRVAIECAGFERSEADALRKSMATFKSTGGIGQFRDRLVSGMMERGYERDFAERMVKQLEGFGSYGFPESHAASFARLAYISCWLKRHHPDVFLAALVNAQPMGFYHPSQLVRNAREHGVEVRPVCINASDWDCTLEAASPGIAKRDLHIHAPPPETMLAVRLGFRMTQGLAEDDGKVIVTARASCPYRDIEEVQRRSHVSAAALERLADVDAFAGLGLPRRAALWAVRALRADPLPLIAAAAAREARHAPELAEPPVALTPMTPGREVVEDYRHQGLSLRAHPVSFLRADLDARGIVAASYYNAQPDGTRLTVSGLVLVRQRPGSAKGVMFITLEDETDIANLVVWPKVYERQRRLVLTASMVAARGRVQRHSGVVHLVVERFFDLTGLLRSVGDRGEPFPIATGRGDEAKRWISPDPRSAKPLGHRPRVIEPPDLRIRSGITVRARDFR